MLRLRNKNFHLHTSNIIEKKAEISIVHFGNFHSLAKAGREGRHAD
jgi:nucleoid DNA-binding protein